MSVCNICNYGKKMNISPEKMAEYRRTAHQKWLKTQIEQDKRRENALRVAQYASVLLKETYNAKRVILFGSLARNGIFDWRSDIDLAVEGLDEKKYYRVLADLSYLDISLDIDLVMMENASPALLKNILDEGQTL